MPAAPSAKLSGSSSWVKRLEQKSVAPPREIVAELIQRRAANSGDIFRPRGRRIALLRQAHPDDLAE